MGNKNILRVFVASPSDVSEERERIKDVIDDLNCGIAENKGLILQYVDWKTHAWPGIGDGAQDIINKQIGPFDIFIGIMWKYFGTPTKNADSGTEEEFERAYSLWVKYGKPHIMIYFNKAPFSPSSQDDLKQMSKVLKFKKKARDKGALYWEYNGPEEFERSVKNHLTKEILKWEDNGSSINSPSIVKFPLDFYQGLFNELNMYINQFEQLQRDYERELNGKLLQFAVDFSEIHDYMYPYSSDSPRSSLNRYVFNTIENQLTLMPGAVGELLTELERALPHYDFLERDPMAIYQDVSIFTNNFPRVMNNEEKVIKLYSRAETQLKKAWGELFDVVIQGLRHTAFNEVKSLIDKKKLSPIEGIREIAEFPLDVREKAQWVRSRLNFERPDKDRNNQVDTIDFAVTWLLNMQKHSNNIRYFSIYTQSQHFINACTGSQQLLWEDDYLVRGAMYFKFRTRIQELFQSTKKRHDFVVSWLKKCKELQNEIPALIKLNKDPSKLINPSLFLLDRYREFDVECRIPLSFSGESSKSEKFDIRNRASELYRLLKNKGEFRGRMEEAFEVLKSHLIYLQSKFILFAPEKVQSKDAKKYMRNIANWLKSERIDRIKTEKTRRQK